MPVPDQVRDDGSGIQNMLKSLDSGLRRNDALKDFHTFYETINVVFCSLIVSGSGFELAALGHETSV